MGDYPIQLNINPQQPIARWRPFLHIFMAIPHFIVLYALNILASVMAFIGLFAVLFTKQWPSSMLGLWVMAQRYSNRTMSYVLLMRESYPPFDFAQSLDEPGNDAPTHYSMAAPGELQRFSPLYQWFLALPHFIALFFLSIAAMVVFIIGWFAVLFTGRWPPAMAKFMIGVLRWSARVNGYVYFTNNQYPPFSLE